MNSKLERHKLKAICAEVGVSYRQVSEVLKRVASRVLVENAVIETNSVGTFRRQVVKARIATYQGVEYPQRAYIAVGLKGVRSIDGGNSIVRRGRG